MIRTPTHLVWVVCQGRLKKIHADQLRHGSPMETEIANNNVGTTFVWTFVISLMNVLGDQTVDLVHHRHLVGVEVEDFHQDPNEGISLQKSLGPTAETYDNLQKYLDLLLPFLVHQYQLCNRPETDDNFQKYRDLLLLFLGTIVTLVPCSVTFSRIQRPGEA